MAATWTARQTANTSKNRRALLLSLVLGLLAAFLLFRLVTAAQPKSAAPVTVPVLVAKQDIPARTVVTGGMVAVKQVPASLRLASAFTDSKVAIGQAARAPISAGEQVLTSQITSNTVELGFSGQVPAGMRAVSINVQEVVNSGNLVQPGDSVDVIGVFQVVRQNGGRQYRSGERQQRGSAETADQRDAGAGRESAGGGAIVRRYAVKNSEDGKQDGAG